MLTRSPAGAVLACALVALVLAGCGQDPDPAGGPSTSSPTAAPTTDPTPTATPTAAPTPTPTPTRQPPRDPDAFTSAVRRLTAAEQEAMTGVSWRPGCPVGLDRLRAVTVAYRDWGLDRRTGVLVVRDDVAAAVVRVFATLYDADVPIRRIRPVDDYDGDDFTSIEADNTSAFNCRPQTGSDAWSQHAYGLAIDLNPLENPFVFDGGRTSHERSVPYLDRRPARGVITADGPVVAAFAEIGWTWGGTWAEPTDYQHFSRYPLGTPDTELSAPLD